MGGDPDAVWVPGRERRHSGHHPPEGPGADRGTARRRRARRQRRRHAPDARGDRPGDAARTRSGGVRAATGRRARLEHGHDLHAAAGHGPRGRLPAQQRFRPFQHRLPLRTCFGGACPSRRQWPSWTGSCPRGPGCSERGCGSGTARRWTIGSTGPTWPAFCAPFPEQQVIEDTERVRQHFRLVRALRSRGRHSRASRRAGAGGGRRRVVPRTRGPATGASSLATSRPSTNRVRRRCGGPGSPTRRCGTCGRPRRGWREHDHAGGYRRRRRAPSVRHRGDRLQP